MSQDINGYPELNTENKNIKFSEKQNYIEVKPQTEIIYVNGGATPDIATRTKLGVVKIGNDLDITAQGLLSAAVHIENLLQNETIILNCGTSTTLI